MGTAPPSTLKETASFKAQKDPSVLLHLISLREWQKVIIRVTLFPGEVTQRQNMTCYGVQWSLIPLHLACALQPPSEGISMLLNVHSDTASVRMNRCSPPSNNKKRIRWHRRARKKHAKKKLAAKGGSNQGSGVPTSDTEPSSSPNDDKVDHSGRESKETYKHASSSDSSSLLDNEAFIMEGELSRRVNRQ